MIISNISLVFIIQCHKGFEQINLLVNNLNIAKNDNVIIHVDCKNNKLFNELYLKYINRSNVHVIKDRVNVYWSDISQVIAIYKMMNYIYEKKIKFDYCIHLSGEDLLIKPLIQLKIYLNEHKKSFIQFRDDSSLYKWRINRFNFFRSSNYSRNLIFRMMSKISIKLQCIFLKKRNNFNDTELLSGSCWFILKENAFKVILNEINEDLFRRLKYSTCADEHIFQILVNRYCSDDMYMKKNLHYIEFDNGKSSPNYLTLDSINSLDNKEYFFVRKVSYLTIKNFLEDNKVFED